MALCDVRRRQGLAQLWAVLLALPLCACGPSAQSKLETADAPDMLATADLDAAATAALKQTLLTSYPAAIATQKLEADLLAKGYECTQDPADPAARACLKVVTDQKCDLHTIIPTKPFAPNKAQVIRICAAKPS